MPEGSVRSTRTEWHKINCPEGAIFLGALIKKTEAASRRYEAYFNYRGIDTKSVFLAVSHLLFHIDVQKNTEII